MPIPRRAMLILPVGILLAGAGTAAYVATGNKQASTIGGPFTLVDGNGKTVTDRDFRGKWMLVYFGYTHCPDACPTALADMSDAVTQIGAKKEDVALLFITIDPARDTPAVMKDYVSSFPTPITALSGTPAQVAAAAQAYRVYYAKHPTKDGDYEMDHSSIIYVMNPDGDFVTNFTHESSPQQVAERLNKLI